MVSEKCDPNGYMTVPVIVLTALIVLFGVYPTPVINFVQTMAQSMIL